MRIIFIKLASEFTAPCVLVVGAMMIAAWGLLAPVGILMAIFYKVVWPSGEWFYVSHNRRSLLRNTRMYGGLTGLRVINMRRAMEPQDIVFRGSQSFYLSVCLSVYSESAHLTAI